MPSIAARYLSKARKVRITDDHTDLDPYGHGERIILYRRDTPALGRVSIAMASNSKSSDVIGEGSLGLNAELTKAGKEVTGGMALQSGVAPLVETLNALRADIRLDFQGKLDSQQAAT